MKISVYLLLLSATLFSGCLGCKNDCETYGPLTFDLPLQAYGIRDTLHIGDTLRIRLDIPDQMPERSSGYMYDFIDYNFRLITYMSRVDSTVDYPNSNAYGYWIPVEGESKYVDGVYFVLPEYKDRKYQYEILYTPKTKGLFEFGMNSDYFRLSPLAKLEGPCSSRPVDVFMKLTNDTNVNYEFLKTSPNTIYQNIDRKRFDEYAGFCFYVR